MTYTPTETDWIVQSTQSVYQVSETLGFPIYGQKFWIGSFPSGSTVRGYVLIEGRKFGPVTLNNEDIKKEQK